MIRNQPSYVVFQYLQAKLLQEKQIPKDIKEEISVAYDIDSLIKLCRPWADTCRRILIKIKPLTPDLAYYIMTLLCSEIEHAEKLASEW